MVRVTIVVWDTIGNTLLGVRPWPSWSPDIRNWLLAEDPEAEDPAPPLGRHFAGTKVDARWFLKKLPRLGIVGSLTEDFALAQRRWTSNDDLPDAVAAAANLVPHQERLPPEALRGRRGRA